jgi:NO-binding membrane sensor protein with MHYT domain
MKDYMSVGIYAVGAAIIVGLVVWYTHFVWSDYFESK